MASSRASLLGALRLALQKPIQDMLAAVVDSTALPAPICADAGAPALRTRRSVSRVSNSCLTRIAFVGSAALPSLSASSLSCALTCEGIGISSCYYRRSNSTPSGPARLDSVHVLEPVATASGHIVTPSDEFPEALLYRGIAAYGEPLMLWWVLQHLGQTRAFLMSSNGRVWRVGVGIPLI